MLYFGVCRKILQVSCMVVSNTGQRWRWAYLAGVFASIACLLTVGFEELEYPARADVVQYTLMVTLYLGSLLLYICSF